MSKWATKARRSMEKTQRPRRFINVFKNSVILSLLKFFEFLKKMDYNVNSLDKTQTPFPDERISESESSYSPSTHPASVSTFISSEEDESPSPPDREGVLQKAAEVSKNLGLDTLASFISSVNANATGCGVGDCKWSDTCVQTDYLLICSNLHQSVVS